MSNSVKLYNKNCTKLNINSSINDLRLMVNDNFFYNYIFLFFFIQVVEKSQENKIYFK